MTRDEIERVWLTDEAVWIETKDGRTASEEFKDFTRLRFADKKSLENYELEYYGIHWGDLDEDLSYEGFFYEKKPNKLYSIFIAHPELNASVIARRLGMSQSLMSQYISGSTKPSREYEDRIINELHSVGAELQLIS